MTPPSLPPYTRMLRKRIRAYFTQDDNRATWSGRLLVVLFILMLGVALVPPVIGLIAYVFRDPAISGSAVARELAYGVLRALVRAGLGVFAFTAALNGGILAVHHIFKLPIDDARTRAQAAFGLVRPETMNVEQGRVDSKDTVRAFNLAGGPGTVAVVPNTAVVTEKNGVQRRVLGGGIHLLENFERIFAAVDLRVHCAARETGVQTKDGIPIQAEGEVEFHIRRASPRLRAGLPLQDLVRNAWLEWVAAFYRSRRMPERAEQAEAQIQSKLMFDSAPGEQEGSPFAFDDGMVLRAVYSQSLARDGAGKIHANAWTENIAQMAMAQLAEVLGDLTLDRITEPEDAPPDRELTMTETPRWQIQQEVLSRIQSHAARQGCQAERFSLGRIRLDPKHVDQALQGRIEDQRHQTWSAEWNQRAQMAQANSAAESLRRRAHTRAEWQARLVRRIVSGLPEDWETEKKRQLVLVRTLDYLDDMRRDPKAAQLFTPTVVAAIDRVRALVS